MAANLNRKAVSFGTGQSLVNFGFSKQPEVIYIEKGVELRALEFEAEVFKIQVLNKKQSAEMRIQAQVELVDEDKEQQPIQKIKTFQCEDCQNLFSTESSLKKHIKEVHSGRAKIYFKHDKVEGRYQCTSCMKSYTHSAKVKRHMQKHHLSKFLIKDEETQNLGPAQRKNNSLESQKEQQDRLKRQKRLQSMNQLANGMYIACLQERAIYIPALNAIDISSCIENYLNIDVPSKVKLIVVDEFACKVYQFKYLIKNEQYQNEFSNEYIVLREAKKRQCKNLARLDGVILGHGFIALRLKKFELTLRENDKGVKELHDLGNAHRYLKTENLMLNLCPLEVVVIDFNRPIRQEIVTLAKVLGTPGYFPIREKQTNGSVQWYVWAVAAIILEYDMKT